jgi:hypothetical protein
LRKKAARIDGRLYAKYDIFAIVFFVLTKRFCRYVQETVNRLYPSAGLAGRSLAEAGPQAAP